MTPHDRLAITAAIGCLKEEQSVDDPDCGDDHCPDCQASRERARIINGLSAYLTEDSVLSLDQAMYQLTVKEKDRERIINTELRLEVKRLKRILDIHGIDYSL